MKHKTLVQFGKRVKEERLKLGISQEKLAAKAGVHRTYIGMIERAEKILRLRILKKLLRR